jgi:1,4-alpha-glucan branching enzyme
MRLIDHLHQRGVGVILDWVPSHFPVDPHGLSQFDGTHLYEHADPRKGWQPDWGSAVFNYGRHEVRSFLISSAMSWLDRYHVDGLRVDAVASMLYLDYSRGEGQWIPNEHGGRENLEAVHFLQQMNEAVFAEYPDTTTFAEESTAWPMVTQPTHLGGLGFGFKWDMGWMNDTLRYFQRDPIHRSWHHHDLTFRSIYAFSENYVLPLSHDEVVHGKGSLVGKMPGDRWQQLANLRLLYAWQWAQPGKKLLFMGGELAQSHEWAHEATLEWWRHDEGDSAGVRRWLADLDQLYRELPAMHLGDCTPDGFQWIEADDAASSIYAFMRTADGHPPVVVVVNATPTVHHHYRIGVPVAGEWAERLNSDAGIYGGSGVGNLGSISTTPIASHGHYQSLHLTIPPLAALFLHPA